jgi:hypothetical protein
MVIYGLSQSNGAERRLEIARSGAGISLGIYDHVSGEEQDQIVVLADDLMAAIINRSEGSTTIEDAAQTTDPKKQLDVEIRRNEVQLRTRGERGCDVAVGLDDFQDALEGVVSVG